MGRVLQMQCPANCINCPKCKIDRKLDVLVYSVSVCSSSSSSSKGKTQKILIMKRLWGMGGYLPKYFLGLL